MAKFSKSFLLFILFTLTVILFIPAIGIKFSWVDDGWDIQMCQKFIGFAKSFDFGHFFDLFFERSNGRFRPVYWLWLIASYLIGENNPTIHYLLHFILIFATTFLIFKTVFLITKSEWASFFAGSLFLINPINTENWYRLGPQEPIIGFFMIASVFLLLRGKNKWLPILLLLLAFFSKETAFALFPGVIVVYLGKMLFLKKRDFSLERYFLASLIFFGVMLLITSQTRSGYSKFYVFNIQEMTHRFLVYVKITFKSFEPFFILFVFTLLLRIIFSFKRLRFKFIDDIFLLEVFGGIIFVSFLVVQSPWKYALARYMLPATIGLVIFMGTELDQVNIILKGKYKRLYKIIAPLFLTFLLFFLLNNLFITLNHGRGTTHGTTHVQKMIKYLAKDVPQNGKVFLNFAKGEGTIELVVETGMHLELFYQRADIKVDYLDLDNLPPKPYYIVSGSSAPHGYGEAIIEKQLMIKPEVEIRSEGTTAVITNPNDSLKQFLKKVINLVFYKEKFTLEGIYAPYYLKDYWKIYHVES